MEQIAIEVTFLPMPHNIVDKAVYYRDLGELSQALSSNDIAFEESRIPKLSRKAIASTAVARMIPGVGSVADTVILLKALMEHAESLAIAVKPTAVPVLTGLTGAWLQARFGRKVRIKIGEIEAEAPQLQRWISY